MTCVGCKHHIGDGCCRINLESECAAGGGYEAREPSEEQQSDERVMLKLTMEQALVVERACELLARLHIGQFNTVTELLLDIRRGMADYCLRRDTANDLLKMAAITIFGRGTYGQPDVKGKSIDHERAWLVYTTLRYARSWHDNPAGGFTVNYDKPMSIGEYMPKCIIAKDDEQ